MWNGKQYALNLSARTLQLYVNTQLFDANNVKLPTTLDEFTSAAKALTDASKDQFGLVLVNVAHSRLYESILLFTAGQTSGAHFSQGGKPALNSPEVVNSVTYFKSLFDAGVMPKGVKDANAQYPYFNSGQAAMSIDGAWYIAVLKSQSPEVFKTTKVLSIPTQTHATTGRVNNVISIAKASKYKEAVGVLLTIWSFKLFTVIYVLTAGGPGSATETLAIYSYEQRFKFYNLGTGSTVAMLMVLVSAFLVAAYFFTAATQ